MATRNGEPTLPGHATRGTGLYMDADLSYGGDVNTTAAQALASLLEDVNGAAKELQTAEAVPQHIADLVDDFENALHAEAPLRLDADPYLTTMLFAGAFRAEKALRHDNHEFQRRELRLALEQFRHALRDIVLDQPMAADTPVRTVLNNLVSIISIPQAELARLLGVSTRQLQRWLASDGPVPTGSDEARIRIVAQLANQLRHAFTGPGVFSWFYRQHPILEAEPAAWLDDPIRYPALLSAARAARAMTG